MGTSLLAPSQGPRRVGGLGCANLQGSRRRNERQREGQRESTPQWRRKGYTEPWKGDRKIWRAGGRVQTAGSGPKREQGPKSRILLPEEPTLPPTTPGSFLSWILSWPAGLGVWLCVHLMEPRPPKSSSQIFLHLHPTQAWSHLWGLLSTLTSCCQGEACKDEASSNQLYSLPTSEMQAATIRTTNRTSTDMAKVTTRTTVFQGRPLSPWGRSLSPSGKPHDSDNEFT